MAQAREISPHWPPAAFRHGEILAAYGDHAGAVAAFDAYLTLDPGDRMGAALKLALIGARPMPDRLPDAYIASLFDEYAARFDRHLTEKLGYDVPQTIAAVIDRLRPDGALRILDIGCGTGLSGAALAHRKQWLEGVDLSAAMIAQAQGKALYDHLHAGDMLAYMRAHAAAAQAPVFDVIVAADVLIYTGDLRPAFDAARPLLAPDGLFVFSLQDGAPDGAFILGADHRYAYSSDYVQSAAKSTGFSVIEITNARLRRDAGRDVTGMICVLGTAAR
jgi:predicted TPR repeat methyltransferase